MQVWIVKADAVSEGGGPDAMRQVLLGFARAPAGPQAEAVVTRGLERLGWRPIAVQEAGPLDPGALEAMEPAFQDAYETAITGRIGLILYRGTLH
jgi:hypothetical protein